jgi:putative transcriptional regulator
LTKGGYDCLENKVELLRKEKGLSQEEFAREVRVSRQTISSIETGKYNPSLELAFIIANYFGKAIEDIFIYGEGNKDEKR